MFDNAIENSTCRKEFDSINVHIGSRISFLRTLRGMSQEQLCVALVANLGQVQQYESGETRIGGSRLLRISHILNVPLSFFFADTSEGPNETFVPGQDGRIYSFAKTHDSLAAHVYDSFSSLEILELVHAYSCITDRAVRKHILEVVKSLVPVPPPFGS